MGSNLVRPRRSMTNAMAAWKVTGTSHRTNNIKWANLMGRTGSLLANRSAHKGDQTGSYRHRRKVISQDNGRASTSVAEIRRRPETTSTLRLTTAG